MLIAPIPDRIDVTSEVLRKLRATAEPEAQTTMKHQLAAAAAQIGILP